MSIMIGYNTYFVRKTGEFKGLNGKTKLEYGEIVVGDRAGKILKAETPIMYLSSETADSYLVQNDDFCGKERSELVNEIISIMSLNDGKHIKRKNILLNDVVASEYRRKEIGSEIIWKRKFYDASILVLRHIRDILLNQR